MSSDTKYTEEELAALPQTDTVFDRAPVEFDNHEWVQEGYFLRDVCSPSTVLCHNGGIPIPSGKLLVKQNGKYELVPEARS